MTKEISFVGIRTSVLERELERRNRRMPKLKADTMRRIEVKVARELCRVQGDFDWKYLQDVDGNPSTAYEYHQFLRMGRAAVRMIEKEYAVAEHTNERMALINRKG